MAAKFFVVACTSALLISTLAACPCGSSGAAWPSGAIGSGAVVPSRLAAGNGGGLILAVTSPIAPTGLSILSENYINGNLQVEGRVPLLAAVAFEGTVPSAGAAGTAYSCGNGNVGMSAESLAAAGLSAGALEAGRFGAARGPWAGSPCGI